ncbi:MAG TPA: hypothetical protein VJW23_15255, partial [Propionibacteriaceae bacterium]|nr:hypothetical protein [Propionibacteriaceae bacterium]
ERGRIGLRLSSDPAVTGKSVEELTAVGIGPGSGAGSLDAEEPRRGRRVRRERRRAEPIGSAEAAPSGDEDAPVRITALAADVPPDDWPMVLARRAVALIKLYSDIQLMTISASRGVVAELEQRRDGVVTIRSRFLSPGQRVLPAHAKTQLGQLTESALRQLPAAEMGSVEVHTQPSVQGDPPSRVLASERQLATAADLVAALRRGTSRRQIELEEDRGVLRLVRADDLVDLIVSIDSTQAEALSMSLDEGGLEGKVVDCLVEISSWSGFGGDALEDRFPLPGVPSYGETRALIDTMVRTHGDFTLWETDPVERMVLSARMNPERELVLERPHVQPTLLRFGFDMESIERLQSAIEEVREFHGEALEVRATLLVWLARKAPPPMGNEPSRQRRRWGRPD